MQRQTGITLVGFVFILIVAAFFAYTGMKLVPAYMDYLNVVKALNTVASQVKSSGTTGLTPQMMHDQLDKQELSQYFDDSDIAENNISIVNDPKQGASLKLAYDKQVHWLYNIDFLMHFEKTVALGTQAEQAQ